MAASTAIATTIAATTTVRTIAETASASRPFLRAAYPEPQHADAGRSLPPHPDSRIVVFLHPSYPEPANSLLEIEALDSPAGGLHHETARIACAIVANCAWSGYLSESRVGPPVQLGEDDLLTADRYYFRIDSDENYPIVASFRDFRFPHHNLPAYWQRPSIAIAPSDPTSSSRTTPAMALMSRDKTCRITNHVQGKEIAHLVPKSEFKWFENNGMSQYVRGSGHAGINDPRNCIALRSDIHFAFDKRDFVIAPKGDAWISHVFYSGETARLFHNVELQQLADVRPELLFARFAWTILGLAMGPTQPFRKSLLLFNVDNFQTETRWLTSEEYRHLVPSSRSRTQSRSSSPKKRSLDELAEQDALDHGFYTNEDDLDDPDDSPRGGKQARTETYALSSLNGSLSPDSPATDIALPGADVERHNADKHGTRSGVHHAMKDWVASDGFDDD